MWLGLLNLGEEGMTVAQGADGVKRLYAVKRLRIHKDDPSFLLLRGGHSRGQGPGRGAPGSRRATWRSWWGPPCWPPPGRHAGQFVHHAQAGTG
jgi:hypothetical protein